MGFRLRTGLSFCLAGGEPVFLDTIADRYFSLTEGGARSFMELVNATPDPALSAGLAGLARNRVIEPTADDARPIPCPAPSPAAASLLDVPRPPLNLLQFAAAASELAWVTAMLKRGRFHALLEGVRRRKARLSVGDPAPDKQLEVAAAFAQNAYWSSPHDRCLARSIAVARRLIASGCRPDLILGIQLQPFRAHCWVQCGAMLVNDRRDTVEPFTPILMV
ncbi:lasso peptide biosynthesis B2 protein [soil metagenome]